jgi:hypothetical protein
MVNDAGPGVKARAVRRSAWSKALILERVLSGGVPVRPTRSEAEDQMRRGAARSGASGKYLKKVVY